jgi:SAM-dependent methyltransferase
MKAIENLLNRPMLQSDLAAIRRDPVAKGMRELVHAYRKGALPVLNGSLAYSNFAEGDAHSITCHEYRLWEYASLFKAIGSGRRVSRFVDIGGAGSVLSYYLAENGFRGVAIDLQPLLVALCNHVANVRNLPLQGLMGNVTEGFRDLDEQFDVATCISVLEHVPADARPALFRRTWELLKPGGLLYLTFDYGNYRERNTYGQADGETTTAGASINDIFPLAAMIEDAGFRFLGDDPRLLPRDILALQSSPGAREFMWRYTTVSRPFDTATPWKEIGKYLIKRITKYKRALPSRFDQHNFFRLFLEKPA